MTARDPRDESEFQRDDRNLAELLQELRVAGLGVQVLFGCLLSLPFTMRFAMLSHAQRQLYIASLMLAALSTAPASMSRAESASDQLYSPAVTSGRI